MKKLLYLMLAFVFVFTACSSDESNIEESTNANTFNPSEIIGVWSDGKYYISFGSDGFYSAYIADDFIDCGIYEIAASTVGGEYKTDNYWGNIFLVGITGNSHFSDLDTRFIIQELSDSTIMINVSYTIRYPYKSDDRNLTLIKTNYQPVTQKHSFIGYSFSEKCIIDGKESNVTTIFSTYNTGQQSTDHEEAWKFPITLHYIYLENTIYYQKKIPNRQLEGLPIWYGWNDDDTGTVSIHICN